MTQICKVNGSNQNIKMLYKSETLKKFPIFLHPSIADNKKCITFVTDMTIVLYR